MMENTAPVGNTKPIYKPHDNQSIITELQQQHASEALPMISSLDDEEPKKTQSSVRYEVSKCHLSTNSTDFESSTNLDETPAIIVRKILEETLDSVFETTSKARSVMTNLSEKRGLISNSSIQNQTPESIECFVSSTSNAYKNNAFSSSILRNLLTGGVYYPPYLPKGRLAFSNFSGPGTNTPYLPDLNEKSTPLLQMRSEHLINDTLLYTIKAEINNVCNTHPNMCSLAVPKGCTHDQQHVKSIAGLCSTKNIAVFMEEKHLSNNYMFSAVTQNVSFPTSTESSLIELLLNKTDNLACSIPSETQSDHYNKISSLESASSSTLSLFDENTENTTQLNLKSDQIVPSDFIENNQMALNLPTHEVMQSKFETSKNYTIQTASMITNSDKDLSGQNSTLKPCGLIEITTQNKIVLSLVNKIALNDFDGIPSKILSLLQPSPSNSNTTGIESYSDVGNRNQFSSPLESKFVDSPKNTTQINISHKTVDCKLVSKESNAVLNMRDSAISNILNVTQRNYAGSCDKDTVKPNNCNYNSLLNISKYDSSKENCDISEETFTELHEDEVLCNSPLPSNERTDVVEARDVDELDEVIDDSINRFENFTVDVGVLATPSIAEKSCQTELIGDDYVKCKRCLELDNCRSEPAKKPRIGLNEMLDLQYETRNTNYSYIDSKESQTQFITRDLPNIIERKCYSDHDITSRSNILIPNHLEAVQFTNVYPSVNNDIQLRLIEDIQGYHREGTDEIDEMEEDENYLFEEKKTDRSNKDESEQEVPSNATFNKEYPPPPPHPFVTPKKPVLRVGLPRSARFKPLHPRV